MYFESKISIDPSQLTEIHRIKPTKGFARLAHLLTAGVVKSQEERETFCAISILQQINIVMRSAGINNIVRLAKDDTVIYEDTAGRENDLKHAIDEFSKHVSTEDRKFFNSLNLTLEHEADDLVILIDIHINRSHEVGEHPIDISINGLCTRLGVNEDEDDICDNMSEIFTSQSNYDSFIDARKESFEKMLSKIEDGFVKHMNVDDVHVQSKMNIIRPSRRINKRSDIPKSQSGTSDPVYMDHYGWDDHSYYAWTWADHCHEHDIQCRDVTIVDSEGNAALSVNEEGFSAGEGDTMNVDADFTLPDSSGVVAVSGSQYDDAGADTSKAAPAQESSQGGDALDTGGSASDGESRGFFSSIAETFGSMTESLGDSIGSFAESMCGGGDGGGGGGCGGGCGG